MSLVIDSEKPVHFPKNRDVFQFDEEVAEIFENMAQRSIPMYAEMHRVHVEMFKDVMESGRCTVVDVGASTGRFFRTMREALCVKSISEVSGLSCIAVESSEPMQAKLAAEFPDVLVLPTQVPDAIIPAGGADIMVMFYLLQFVQRSRKQEVMNWAYDNLNEGGILLMGNKETNEDVGVEDSFQKEYINFRIANGYSREEIMAKTAALKNAMWCVSESQLIDMGRKAGFRHVVPTLRWLDFSTHIFIK